LLLLVVVAWFYSPLFLLDGLNRNKKQNKTKQNKTEEKREKGKESVEASP